MVGYNQTERAEVYNIDAVAYESLMVFFLSIYWPNCRWDNPGHPECTVVYVGFSRDGYHFTRTDAPRVPFAPWGKVPGAWNYGQIFLLHKHIFIRLDWNGWARRHSERRWRVHRGRR